MQKNTKSKTTKGVIFLLIGIILLFIAGGWYIYNLVEDNNAGKYANEILDQMSSEQKLQNTQSTTSETVVIKGDSFCGRVIINKLGIELPIYDEWSYARLKTAPCRYMGSVATNDIIIAAHNYKSHFGSLNKLQIGDEIIFIDAQNTAHTYSVCELVTLDGTAVEDIQSGGWDFTLFTCTKGGKQRVTVRCQRK